MPPDPTPPLPLAANRAALSNRISLLLASQSSVLKTMNLSRPAPSSTSKRRAAPDDDDDLTRGSRPNEGVGYVPEKKDAQKFGNSKEERMLRGRIGKDSAKGGKSRKLDESESEDEVGRSALGKRKRPRRETQPEAKTEAEEQTGETEIAKSDGDVDMQADVKNTEDAREVSQRDGMTNKKRKKNKKKKPKSGTADK